MEVEWRIRSAHSTHSVAIWGRVERIALERKNGGIDAIKKGLPVEMENMRTLRNRRVSSMDLIEETTAVESWEIHKVE